jgi:hydrogenase 3 maturation protease
MKTLESLFRKIGPKFVLLGVGNPLRADDGAGPELLRRLRNKTSAILLDCEEVPENYLGEIAAIQPETIVVIDAVNLGAGAGAVALLEEDNFQSIGWSTHHGSLRALVQYIKATTQADVFVLGIQPKSTELGGELSPEVRQTIDLLQQIITAHSVSGEPPCP